MPRPTDIAQKATAESRRKGALAANAKRRELRLTLQERIARKLEQRADELVDALVASVRVGDLERARSTLAIIEQAAAQQPDTLLSIPPERFARIVEQLDTQPR